MTRTFHRRRFDYTASHGTTDPTERRLLRLAHEVSGACSVFLASRGIAPHSWRTDPPQAILEATSGQAGGSVTPLAHPESLDRFAQTPSAVPFVRESRIGKKRGNPKHESKVTH